MAEKRIWELLSRKFNNEISEAELQELQDLIRQTGSDSLSPELLLEIKQLDISPTADDETRRKNSLEAIRNAIGTGDAPGVIIRSRKWQRWTMISTAAALLLVVAGYYLRSDRTTRTSEQFETIVTRAGSKTFINLPDSSTVLLNSACKFRYNKTYGAEGREIELAGEAYFDIRKTAEVPLVVHAGNVIIRVLGTSFDVKANPDDSFVEATLIKGVIEVSLLTDPERKILLRPNEKIVIRKNEDLPMERSKDAPMKNKDAVIAVTRVAPDPVDSSVIETIWTKNKMLFHKEHFSSLAKKMERWYNVSFVLTDTSLNEMIFTGSLEKESLTEALNALQHAGHFNYTIEGQTVTITK